MATNDPPEKFQFPEVFAAIGDALTNSIGLACKVDSITAGTKKSGKNRKAGSVNVNYSINLPSGASTEEVSAAQNKVTSAPLNTLASAINSKLAAVGDFTITGVSAPTVTVVQPTPTPSTSLSASPTAPVTPSNTQTSSATRSVAASISASATASGPSKPTSDSVSLPFMTTVLCALFAVVAIIY
jgi:hypothetical protein